MAKSKAPPSKHSRAARRATSPGIDTDKSLKDIPLPIANSSAKNRPSILAVHQSAGIQKKSKGARKTGRMSFKMRRRHERGLEMAEAVTERTGKKIEKSIGRAKNVQARRKNWEDINKEAVAGEDDDGAVAGSRFGALMMDEDDDNDDEEEGKANGNEDKEWETDDEIVDPDDFDPRKAPMGELAASMHAPSALAAAGPAPARNVDDDNDEIL